MKDPPKTDGWWTSWCFGCAPSGARLMKDPSHWVDVELWPFAACPLFPTGFAWGFHPLCGSVHLRRNIGIPSIRCLKVHPCAHRGDVWQSRVAVQSSTTGGLSVRGSWWCKAASDDGWRWLWWVMLRVIANSYGLNHETILVRIHNFKLVIGWWWLVMLTLVTIDWECLVAMFVHEN